MFSAPQPQPQQVYVQPHKQGGGGGCCTAMTACCAGSTSPPPVQGLRGILMIQWHVVVVQMLFSNLRSMYDIRLDSLFFRYTFIFQNAIISLAKHLPDPC